MPQLIASNNFLSTRASQVDADMTAECVVRLFVNNLTPTPANVRADFAEAGFTGYAPRTLVSAPIGKIKVRDGLYQIGWGPFTWTNTGATTQVIYGFYVTGGATSLWVSKRFDSPVPLVPLAPISCKVLVQEWALSIV